MEESGRLACRQSVDQLRDYVVPAGLLADYGDYCTSAKTLRSTALNMLGVKQ